MDEGLLNDLLECSVCLERLDTSSRVLPCQHTFCLKCLKVIVESHKELRCPECRVLVEAKVEELPPNVLLMRILEGMRNSAPRKQGGTHRALRTGHTLAAQSGQQSRCDLKQLPPHARAMYDYISKEQGDLSFKKGETIMLQKKLDPYWYQGESAGRTGVFPITYVQVVVPLQIPTALCKALYDFRMSAPDEEGCLAFDKGAIITVHRRVDENWAEGRLEQRVGIFPIAFVELNQAARQLMNSVPLNRAVPPVPEHARPGHSEHRQEHRHHTQHTHRYTPMSASMPTEQSNYQNMSAMSQSQPTTFASLQPVLVPQVQGSVSAGLVTVQRNILEPSTKHSLDLIQFTGKATVGLQSVARINEHYDRVRAGKVEFSAVEPSDSSSATTATPNSSSGSSSSSTCASLAASPDAPAATHTSLNVSLPVELPDTTTRRHDKRHSLTNTHLTATSNANANQNNQNRHSAEILATSLLDHSEPRERRRRRERSSERYLPATYIALYPYKPQKPDELELKKGGIYSVSSVCRDGWFKGWCARSQRGGVFPGNYVAPAPIANTATTNTATTNTATTNTATSNSATANTANSAAHSPAPASTPSNSSHHREKSQGPSSSGAAAPGSKPAAPPPDAPPRENSPHGQQPMSYPWNSQSQSQSQQSTPRSDKSKEKSRVEKSSISTGVSLMKRLAAMKKCKSPPPVGYSMDNPVFEDGPGTSLMLNLAAQHHPVHVRSGSCPSQLLRALPATTHSTHSAHTAQMAHSAQTAHSAAERRHKDRHHEHVLHRSNDGPWQSQHRKSQSLDVTATRRDRHHSQTVKERFRCIVPYPPNSEYELELKLDDIVIVSKKRGDGWYKGTLQRTGRTGLFPASFVQSCPQE